MDPVVTISIISILIVAAIAWNGSGGWGKASPRPSQAILVHGMAEHGAQSSGSVKSA